MKLFARIITLLFTGLISSHLFAENVVENSLSTPIDSKSIGQQEKIVLEDKGDYYYLNNGKKKSFSRKKDYFLLIVNKNASSVSAVANQISANFNDQFEVVDKHSFEGHTLVKVSSFSDASDSDNLALNLQSSLSGVDFVSPVFKPVNVSVDLAITPNILVKLKPMIKTTQLQAEKSLGVGLVVSSKLVDARQEFEYKITTPITADEIFKLTRKIMALPYVKWAEPVMLAPPVKYFTPNDTLYNNQWHLHNTGQNGGKIDADIDAPEGWNLSTGAGTVVAIFDDGVQISHPDLSIWSNPGETGGGKETNGIDDDANGYIDDHQGWDFGDADNNPSPSASNDNHGTAVAGVAAAHGNNGQGVTGSAIDADILPVKSGSMSCTNWGNAMRYAGKYSDVVNNSWGIGACESSLNSAINDVVNGNITGARRGTKGTPVLFATGNSASGWRRFSLSGFPAGTYDFRWQFSKNGSVSEGYDTVWLDDVSWPGGAASGFEGDALGGLPAGFTGSGSANWRVVNDGVHARGATGKAVKAGTISHNQTTQLNTTRTVGAGTLYYWVWVSSQLSNDYFRFYVDGTLYHLYAPGQYSGHDNSVGYPASNPDAIAVGGSQDGGPGLVEERTYYSQFGSEVDVIAPTSGGFQGVTTTDRTGADGYNNSSDYTSTFGGTSSATPLTSGVVADIIAYNPELTALQIRDVLRSGTDKIGPYSYPGGRNDYYGYGRVNLLKTLQLALLTSQNEVVKRAEIAKLLLLAKYGSSYTPPMATGGTYSDVSVSGFNAAWVEKLAADGITAGCGSGKFCPEMVVTKEQLATLLLKAKYGSGYSPSGATGMVFTDISVTSFAARWIEDLSTKSISDGCDANNFCPKEVVTIEGFEKMLNKTFP